MVRSTYHATVVYHRYTTVDIGCSAAAATAAAAGDDDVADDDDDDAGIDAVASAAIFSW